MIVGSNWTELSKTDKSLVWTGSLLAGKTFTNNRGYSSSYIKNCKNNLTEEPKDIVSLP